jgi:1-aminocyclopropane-1-carboxylate deaminase
MDLIKKGYFNGCRLLLVHTGGLQGNISIENKLK